MTRTMSAGTAQYWTTMAARAAQTVPLRSVPATVAALRNGVSPATLLAAAAARHPDRIAIIDDDGSITAGDLHSRVSRLAAALRAEFGIRRGHRVAVLCRNHRGFVEGVLAAARTSADFLPLNYDFPGPQLRGVLERDGIDVLIYDAEFHPRVEAAGFAGVRVIARHGAESLYAGVGEAALPTIDALIARAPGPLRAAARGGTMIIMTAGSTGIPKGAARPLGGANLAQIAAFMHPRMLRALGELPRLARLRAVPVPGEPMLVAPPLHHTFGLLGLFGALAMTSPLIVRDRFDGPQVLADIATHRVATALLVPTMIKRIMDIPAADRARYDTSSLKSVPAAAMPLPPQLGTDFMDAFGDILFNGYASTELGPCTMAYPEDLRAAPGTVGYPIPGIVALRLLDDNGRRVPRGSVGRIFNRNPLQFGGYTDGRSKEVIDGFMSSGDVGHFDAAGRLFIDGRDDEMIVSGGENVFPQEVESVLLTHPAVLEAGATGVPDAQFGQRLAALIVLKPGATATSEELRELVRTQLARYKVPREVHFIDALPRTTSGKLKHNALAGLLPTQATTFESD